MKVWKAPRGRGPYGITATPDGDVYYASLAGNHIARIDKATGEATVIEPPTKGQGARRVWSDSKGPHLGLGVECRPARALRSEGECLARMEAAGRQAAGLRRLRRRAATSSGSPIGAPMRSSPSIPPPNVHQLSDVRGRRQRAPDPRPPRRGLAAGIRRGPADGDPNGPAVAVTRPPASWIAPPAWLPASATGRWWRPVRGEKAFQYCYSCHSVAAGRDEPPGPEPAGHRRAQNRLAGGVQIFPCDARLRPAGRALERGAPGPLSGCPVQAGAEDQHGLPWR